MSTKTDHLPGEIKHFFLGFVAVSRGGTARELARRTGNYAADATEDNVELKITQIAVDRL